MSARRCALEALSTWEDTSRFASDILDDLSRSLRLSPPDRALAQEILYGTIRNLYLLDELISRFRRGSLNPLTQNLLRIGLYQLFKTEIAEHAAVNETVELARKHERSLINAILRNAQRKKPELLEEIETWPLEDRYSHPDFLVKRWIKQYDETSVESFCRWNNEPPVVFARINSLARDREALDRVRSESQPSMVGDSFPDFFQVTGAPNPDWLREGLIYVQDPSTSLACRLLDPKPGEDVLDACAAPGGKTALLAALMNNEGRITATDNSPPRLDQLRENLQRLSVMNSEVKQADWSAPETPANFPAFDAILLDVPCSNTGVMRRRVDVRWRIQERDLARQATNQSGMLRAAVKLLKPGGRIVYSTCSIDRAENESVIEQSGLTVDKIVTSLPWRDGYDGAFAALLRP
ncbi:MAG: 16S rRNA (cytosine(967)-C(5))-methyltransferase RsmB [Verrucomicrobiales bacterium]